MATIIPSPVLIDQTSYTASVMVISSCATFHFSLNSWKTGMDSYLSCESSAWLYSRITIRILVHWSTICNESKALPVSLHADCYWLPHAQVYIKVTLHCPGLLPNLCHCFHIQPLWTFLSSLTESLRKQMWVALCLSSLFIALVTAKLHHHLPPQPSLQFFVLTVSECSGCSLLALIWR